jgi:glycine/D-amino acid oxidase-like deaminating enzyme
MRRTRVVIIGAGVFGLSCARSLAAAGDVDVTVLDRAHPGGGSTGLSAGVYSRQYTAREDIQLRVASVRQLLDLEAEGALTMRRIGFLRLARSEDVARRYRETVEVQHELGVEDATVLDAGEIARLVPDFDATGVVAAQYCPTEGYLDGSELCMSLAERAQADGTTIVVRAPVEAVQRGGSAPFTLHTPAREFEADLVVNCAGAWAQQVGELLEAPVRVINERHEAYIFSLPAGYERTIPMTLDYVLGSNTGEGLYFRHEGERQLVAGLHSNDFLGHEHPSPDETYGGPTHSLAEGVIERLAKAFPALEDIGYVGGWAGLYPHSPTGRPYAGPHPDDARVFIGGGLGGAGLTVAPELGSVLAEWVRFGEPRSRLAPAFVPAPEVTMSAGARR